VQLGGCQNIVPIQLTLRKTTEPGSRSFIIGGGAAAENQLLLECIWFRVGGHSAIQNEAGDGEARTWTREFQQCEMA